MMGGLRTAPLTAPWVVRITTGSPLSSPPSTPSVASYRATWSRTGSLLLGRYSLVMSSRDQVEFVAVGVSERGTPRRAAADLVEHSCAHGTEPTNLAVEVGRDQVRVEAVLGGLVLGGLVKHQSRAPLGRAR